MMSCRLVTKLVLSSVPVIISHSTSRMEPLANLSTPILDSFDLTIGTGEGDGDEGDGLHYIFEGGALKLSHVRIDCTHFAFPPPLTRFASVTTLHLRDMPNYMDGPLSTCLLGFFPTPTSLKTLTRRC